MSWSIAKLATRALNIVVLVASGWYLLVYLYRWEWNRAMISGLFFVAAEIALATSMILDALRRGPPGAPVAAAQITAENARHRPDRFSWLTHNDRLGVFVPVLLGAGVLLSVVAYLVERIAGFSAGPPADRRTAAALPLDLPLGTDDGRQRDATVPSRGRNVVGWIVTAAAIGGVMWFGVDRLADATQSRPSAAATVGTTTIELEIEQRRSSRPAGELAAALWVACRPVVPGVQLAEIVPAGNGAVQVIVTPELGDLRRRRLFGCLQDATLDRVSADVVSWASSPTPG